MSQHLLTVVALLAALGAGAPDEVRAAGSERTLTGHDLVVHVDSRWAGCRYGGYYPIRLRVLNKGPARNLTFRFAPDGQPPLPEVERTVGIEQNATVRFSLSVPMVTPGSYGNLQILYRGDPLGGLSMGITLPAPERGEPRPSLLVVSPRVVDVSGFEEGVNEYLQGGLNSGRFGGMAHVYGMSSNDHEVVPAASLPTNWIDYTGLDLVAIPLDSLTKLGIEERDALLKWVDTGGTLLVEGLKTPAGRSEPLETALQLDSRAAIGPEWRTLPPGPVAQLSEEVPNPFERQQRSQIPGLFVENSERSVELLLALADEETELDAALEPILGDQADDPLIRQQIEQMRRTVRQWADAGIARWPSEGTIPFVREVGLGRVVAFTGDPFEGTSTEWAMLLARLAPSHAVVGDTGSGSGLGWSARHGIVARHRSGDFDRFLIPGVRSVPVVSFLVLITLFTIVIGPLNYYLLWRRRRLNLLVVTIPTIAFVTSVTLFAYSTFSQGFSIRTRIRSVTVLDQRNKSAVTTSRVAMFAGMAPSRGLRFSPETAVYPVWPSNTGFRAAHVDWTETQGFDSGWLRSRTRTQFLTVRHHPARGRIEVAAPANNAVIVSNGLEENVEFLLVRGDDDQYYACRELAAGATVTLQRATGEDRRYMGELLDRNPMTMPEVSGFGRSDYEEYGYGRGYGPYGYDVRDVPEIPYSSNLAERLISRVEAVAANENRDLPPNSYAAVLTNNPDVDLGVEGTRPEAGFHLLLGFR